MRVVISCFALFFVLTGCSTGVPKMYSDAEVADADTAVLVVADDKVKNRLLPQIYKVDGIDTSCLAEGCPVWVRVLPGRHLFAVRYTEIVSFRPAGTSFPYQILELPIDNMKAGHVYVARQDFSTGSLRVDVDVLPSGSRYGLVLQNDGSYKFPVTF